jgi:hypothetical protein
MIRFKDGEYSKRGSHEIVDNARLVDKSNQHRTANSGAD